MNCVPARLKTVLLNDLLVSAASIQRRFIAPLLKYLKSPQVGLMW